MNQKSREASRCHLLRKKGVCFLCSLGLVLSGLIPIQAQRLIWLRSYSELGYDVEATAFRRDSSGRLIVAGTSLSLNNGERDALLAAYDREGNLLWSRRFGDANRQERPVAISVNAQDEIYLLADLLYSFGSPAYLLAKFSPQGDLIWLKTEYVDADYWVQPVGMVVRSEEEEEDRGQEEEDEIYVLLNTASATLDIVLRKYDDQGWLRWSRRYDTLLATDGIEYGVQLSLDPSGNPTVLGIGSYLATGEEGIKATGLILKYTPSGDRVLNLRYLLPPLKGIFDSQGNCYYIGTLEPTDLESDKAKLVKIDTQGVPIFLADLGTGYESVLPVDLELRRDQIVCLLTSFQSGYSADNLLARVRFDGTMVSRQGISSNASVFNLKRVLSDSRGNLYILSEALFDETPFVGLDLYLIAYGADGRVKSTFRLDGGTKSDDTLVGALIGNDKRLYVVGNSLQANNRSGFWMACFSTLMTELPPPRGDLEPIRH